MSALRLDYSLDFSLISPEILNLIDPFNYKLPENLSLMNELIKGNGVIE